MSKLEQVVDIFKDSLEDEDTYIYLSAINGLVASARYYKNICCLMWSVGVTSQGGGWGVVGHSTPMGCAMCTVQLPMTHHPSCRTPVTG